METITKNIKGYDFTFINEFGETKNGFKHHTDLYFGGVRPADFGRVYTKNASNKKNLVVRY